MMNNLTITEIPNKLNVEVNKICDKKLSPDDQKIYSLCKKYGAEALEARRKFAGLLPEVFRRRIFEKKGFATIYEFAAKLSGMSEPQVRLALNLEKSFEDKPLLKSLLVNGEVSIHKLARIVAIATPENQQNLASKVKLLSKSALEVFVKDEKFAIQQYAESESQNGSQKPLFEDKTLPGQSSRRAAIYSSCGQTLNFQISDDIIQQLNNLHAHGHDMNEILQQMLEQRKKQIEQTKNEISENIQPAKSRYVPVKIKTVIKQEYGEKCSIRNCHKPAEILHHKQRFAVSQNHDPQFLIPLCSEHHEIAHTIDVQFHQVRKSALVLGST